MNVYVSISALEEAICDKESVLHKILYRLPGHCIVYTDVSEEQLKSRKSNPDEDLLSYLYLGRDTEVSSGLDVITRILTDSSHVLDDPTAIYILDIQEDQASSIQDNYGVICCSSRNPDLGVLVSEHRTASVAENEPGNWKSNMYGRVRTDPLNSIIVSDRYLFSDDRFVNGETFEKGNGYQNLIAILDCLLPRKKREGEFSVLVYCDAFEFKGNPFTHRNPTDLQRNEMEMLHFKKLSNWLNKDIKKLRAGLYNIEVEVLSFGPNKLYHDKTHNRRILTNYSELYAEHKLAAFQNNRSVVDQNITYNTLFSEGITDKSDCPIFSHDQKLRCFASIFAYGKRYENMYLYSYCGNSSSASIADVKNSLIRSRL